MPFLLPELSSFELQGFSKSKPQPPHDPCSLTLESTGMACTLPTSAPHTRTKCHVHALAQPSQLPIPELDLLLIPWQTLDICQPLYPGGLWVPPPGSWHGLLLASGSTLWAQPVARCRLWLFYLPLLSCCKAHLHPGRRRQTYPSVS